MLKNFFMFILSLIIFASSAQEVESRVISPFSSIKVNGPLDVRLVKGSNYSVKIEADGVSTKEVRTQVSGSNLIIDFKGTSFKMKSNVDVWVTYKDLERVSASGASNIFSGEKMMGKALDLDVSTAATVELEVQVNQLTVNGSTAGQVILNGECSKIDLEGATSSSIDANSLKCESATIQLRTASSAKITVSKILEADISTASSLRYKGNPSKTNLQASTGGSIRKVD